MNYADMSLIEVSKLPGVADLPIKQRGNFAKALMQEARGQHALAAESLEKAIASA